MTKQTCKIMVVHNGLRLKDELATSLGEVGCHVSFAAGRRDALKLLYAVRPDLILLELSSPSDESWDTLARIRLFAETAVLVLGVLAPTDEERVKRLGVLGCIDPSNSIEQITSSVVESLQSVAEPLADVPAQADDANPPAPALLEHLTPAELERVDRALATVGERGQVRLVKKSGRLRWLVLVKTESFEAVTEEDAPAGRRDENGRKFYVLGQDDIAAIDRALGRVRMRGQIQLLMENGRLACIRTMRTERLPHSVGV